MRLLAIGGHRSLDWVSRVASTARTRRTAVFFTASAADGAPSAAAGRASCAFGAGASLAFLRHLTKHGFDHLLVVLRCVASTATSSFPLMFGQILIGSVSKTRPVPSSNHSRFTPGCSLKRAISRCFSVSAGLISSSERSREAAMSLMRCRMACLNPQRATSESVFEAIGGLIRGERLQETARRWDCELVHRSGKKSSLRWMSARAKMLRSCDVLQCCSGSRAPSSKR
jgi:hypothetical protein